MGNTVGSYKNKFWNKKWIGVKSSLNLTPAQKAILVGSLLGDGTLRVGEGAINANFKVEHGLAQQEYVWWKYREFRPWVFTKPKISYRYREDGAKYPKSLWFRTVRHPILTKFHSRFYRGKTKIIPENIGEELDPQVLAVWIMDDGSYSKSKINISTYAFSKKEIKCLLNSISRRYHISGRYHSDRDKGYRIYFNSAESKKLVDILKKFIVPTLNYKIGIL